MSTRKTKTDVGSTVQHFTHKTDVDSTSIRWELFSFMCGISILNLREKFLSCTTYVCNWRKEICIIFQTTSFKTSIQNSTQSYFKFSFLSGWGKIFRGHFMSSFQNLAQSYFFSSIWAEENLFQLHQLFNYHGETYCC